MPELVKRYFQLLWQQRGMAALRLFLATITALAGIALLAVSGWFISATALAGLSLAAAHGFNYFAPGAIVRGLSITRTFGRYGERLTTHEATFRVISHLRSDMFGTLTRHNWQEQPLNSHEASSRLLDDIRHAESIYLSALVPALVMLLSALLYLVTVTLFLPQLALWLLLPLVTCVLLLPALYLRRVLQPQNTLHQQRSQQWSDAHSLFSNLRTLILFGRLSPQSDKLCQSAAMADQTEQLASNARQSIQVLNQLDSWLGKGSHLPSGGELKRLGLARLILQDRQVLLLDEPTAGIDSERSRRILQRLRQQRHNRLVVISSHESDLMGDNDTELRL